MPVKDLQSVLPERAAARAALGLTNDADVVLWLGRLTLLSKSDPAPTYRMLDGLAQKRQRPLVLLELGPDDNPEAAAALNRLRSCFRNLQFRRLGGEKPVTEEGTTGSCCIGYWSFTGRQCAGNIWPVCC